MKFKLSAAAVSKAVEEGEQACKRIQAKADQSRTPLNRRQADDLKAQQQAAAERAART